MLLQKEIPFVESKMKELAQRHDLKEYAARLKKDGQLYFGIGLNKPILNGMNEPNNKVYLCSLRGRQRSNK